MKDFDITKRYTENDRYGTAVRTYIPTPATGGGIIRRGSEIETTITSDGIGGFNVYAKGGVLVNRFRRQS